MFVNLPARTEDRCALQRRYRGDILVAPIAVANDSLYGGDDSTFNVALDTTMGFVQVCATATDKLEYSVSPNVFEDGR